MYCATQGTVFLPTISLTAAVVLLLHKHVFVLECSMLWLSGKHPCAVHCTVTKPIPHLLLQLLLCRPPPPNQRCLPSYVRWCQAHRSAQIADSRTWLCRPKQKACISMDCTNNHLREGWCVLGYYWRSSVIVTSSAILHAYYWVGGCKKLIMQGVEFYTTTFFFQCLKWESEPCVLALRSLL